MKIRVYGADDDTPEEWVTYLEEGEERIELLIRLLSDEKEQSIQRRCFGTLRAGESPSEDRAGVSAREKGSYALVDSRGLELVLEQSGAVRLSQALGVSVEAGAAVALDGKLTPKVKDVLFRMMPGLLGFVVEQGRKLADAAAREEAKVSGN